MQASNTPIARRDVARDFVLPALLFTALGAMTWAVRGCAGAGGMNAHIAPGLTWGAAWWFLARDDDSSATRRYSSGWILLALAAGFAIAGERGWMQWPHFFSGQLAINYGKGEFVPISRWYGFLWFFIAGSAWAGLPACFLAWCASGRPARAWQWSLRLGCGFAGGYFAWRIYAAHPQIFLPLYESLSAKYAELSTHPNLAKLYRDNGASLRHVGFCLGFLLFELARRDWQSVKLILTVGLFTGCGWAACQNWRWAATLWPGASFNFGRCWEVSGGICIGLGLGIAYYLVNRRVPVAQQAQEDLARSQTNTPQWLLGSLLPMALGMTLFWPTPRDPRQPVATPLDGPHYLLGITLLGAGIACGVLALARLETWSINWPRLKALPALRIWRKTASGWAECLLILALSWFIKTQIDSEYGDGVADHALAGWFSPGSFYVALAFAYCTWRLFFSKAFSESHSTPPLEGKSDLPPRFDALFTYLSLTLIVMWCLSVGLENSSNAPIFFGIAVAGFGIAYYVQANVSQRLKSRPGALEGEDIHLATWGMFLGLLYGLGLSLRKACKGGANLYVGSEDAWDAFFWNWISIGMLVCLVAGATVFLRHQKPFRDHSRGVIWLVLISQNLLAQIVTGPLWGARASWNEFAFSLLYLVLFFLTAVIVRHYEWLRQ